MSYERFIARRYLRSGRFFVSISTWITILGVMLGVAVVCFVMSMHNGFETEIRTRLLGTTSHISVFPFRGSMIDDYNEIIDRVEKVDGVEAASAFIYYKAAIASASLGDGIVVRGIDPIREEKTSSVAADIKFGNYTFDPIITEDSVGGEVDTLPGIILGKNLADQLGVYLGDPVVMYSIKGDDLHSRTRPRVAKFYVSGIFETGLYEFDGNMAYISLDQAQKLFRTGDVATTVHLKLTNIFNAEKMSPVIDSVLDYRYDVVPWYVLHRNLFEWIEIEGTLLFVGFSLIVLVAAFSIVSNLVILTMEKRSEIGIMKTIGSTEWEIAKIFLYKGMAIGLGGVILGWSLALLAIYIQNEFGLISLPADIYFISYLPFEIHFIDFFEAGAVTFIASLLAAFIPARQAAKVSVVEVLRR